MHDDQTLVVLKSPLMQYRDHTLYLEDVPLADIARREGTPCYVYSRAAILERFQAYDKPSAACRTRSAMP